MSKMEYLSLPVFSTGKNMKVKIKKVLYKISSDFQDILVVDTEKYGKCLVIDGDMQCAETDHEIYDNEMLKLLKKEDKKILILGGGDGYVAKTALRKNKKVRVVLVDLDAEVINSCRKSLNGRAFGSKRLKLCIGDAFYFLEANSKEKQNNFDGVVCDLTDAPIGRKDKASFVKFYRTIISDSYKILNSGGWISIQSGASKTEKGYLNAVGIIEKLLEKKFGEILRSDVYIPSYKEKWSFLFGRRK